MLKRKTNAVISLCSGFEIGENPERGQGGQFPYLPFQHLPWAPASAASHPRHLSSSQSALGTFPGRDFSLPGKFLPVLHLSGPQQPLREPVLSLATLPPAPASRTETSPVHHLPAWCTVHGGTKCSPRSFLLLRGRPPRKTFWPKTHI